MKRLVRKGGLFTLLALGGGLLLGTHPALAQGPYGRNSYEDFPFNQGSLFYRPLKPKPRLRPRVVQRVAPAAAPVQGGYTYTRPYTYTQPRQGYTTVQPQRYVQRYANTPQPYYYYPAAPAPAAAPTYRPAPAAPAAAPTAPPR